VNRGLIEGMARAGQGEPFVVLRPDRAAAEAEKLRSYIEQPVLTGVNVAFSGFDAYEVAPQKLPDLMARRPLVLFGKYRGAAGGRIEVRGTSGGGPLRQVVEVRPADVRGENAALRWLWARRWVALLDDERAMGAGQAAEDGITALGLDYKLLTAFTSFVAIDSQVVNQGGQGQQGQTVRQPLPMPEGVSNLAVAEPSAAPMKSMGAMGGGGYGHAARRAPAPMAAPVPPPPPHGRMPGAVAADEALDGSAGPSFDKRARDVKSDKKEEQEKKANNKGDAPAAPAWVVTASGVSSLDGTGPLVEAIRAALAGGRAACLAPAGKLIRFRLTIDAHGRIARVEIVTGDRNAEACLRATLAGLSSATAARGNPTGTVEITLRARS
jgi:hypothetical protein